YLRSADLDADGLTDVAELPLTVQNQINPWYPTSGNVTGWVNVGDRLVNAGAQSSWQDWRAALSRVRMAENLADPADAGQSNGTWANETDFADFTGDGLPDLYSNEPYPLSYCNADAQGNFSNPLCRTGTEVLSKAADGKGLRLLSRVSSPRGDIIEFSYAPS